MVGTLKVKDLTGQWVNIAGTGPQGDQGLQGEVGPPYIIVARFGTTRVPADLPTNGAIPADWDEPGTPAYQMVLGNGIYYEPPDPTTTDAGHLYSFVGALSPTGWQDVGEIRGPVGPTGVSSIIVGSFGTTQTPAGLPPDGMIPVDWDAPGNPAAAYQMTIGDSLYYEKPTDPLDGHLFQFVGISIDPLGWIDIGLIQGPAGPTGPTGATGPPTDEIWVDPTPPTLPETELWFDTDDTRIIGPAEIPPGGLAYDGLVKATDLDGDVEWRDVYNVPSGKIIQFPNTADVHKIQLYSTTFGFGIESGTLTAFASSTIRFRQNSITGTEWGSVNSSGFHRGAGAGLTKMQGQILQNGGFSGPWDGEGSAAWTVNLTAGAYIFMFGASGTSTTVAARTIDLKVDGTIEATARLWINQVNTHCVFNVGIGTGSYSAGNHTISIHNGGGTSSDVNDFGWVICIPA